MPQPWKILSHFKKPLDILVWFYILSWLAYEHYKYILIILSTPRTNIHPNQWEWIVSLRYICDGSYKDIWNHLATLSLFYLGFIWLPLFLCRHKN